jgi:hypothetical protein
MKDRTMTASPLPKLKAPVMGANDLADDVGYKDVYFPDPGSEQNVLVLATMGFREAGYLVRQAEKAPHHPVYIFKLKAPPGPPRFVRHRDLRDHLREILSRVGLPMPKDSPLADRNRDWILMIFVLQPNESPKRNPLRPRRGRVGG